MRAIAIAAMIATASAQLSALSATERASLESELAQWKSSEEGQVAIANGFVPGSGGLQATAQALELQLERLHASKQRIAALEKANPEATFGLTQFSLLTPAEFRAYVKRGFKGTRLGEGVGAVESLESTAVESEAQQGLLRKASSVDWTTSGCVAAPKDQGQCGSCWAFATVASIESAQCLSSKKLVLYSEQQVTSCATSAGEGCDGGWEDKALDWVKSNGGLCLGSDYKYTSGTTGQTGSCKKTCKKQALKIKSVVRVPKGEDNLKKTLDTTPTTVAVTAGNDAWMHYTGGIVSDCGDVNAQLDHAVFAVGYGSNYFKIKNSWGKSWGESGYIRIKRSSGNGVGVCQLASEPAHAII